MTVNDVVLAMSSGALRAYLLDQNALPDAPLTAMVPVNLRKDGDDSGGNMVGTFLCNLATDLDDPAKRLETISTSIRDTKEVFCATAAGPATGVVGVQRRRALPRADPRLPRRPRRRRSTSSSRTYQPVASEPLYWHGARLGWQLPAVDRARRAGASTSP